MSSNIIFLHRPIPSNDPAVPREAQSQLFELSQPSPVALAMSGFYDQSPDEPLELDPAPVIRIALRSAARKGRALSSLHPFVRGQLDYLCAAGDPSCILVRDWLRGTGPFDPAGEGRA